MIEPKLTHTTRGACVRQARGTAGEPPRGAPRGFEPVCPPKGRPCEGVEWPVLAVEQSGLGVCCRS